MPKPHLSIIIPSYNEQTNLKRGVLDKVLTFLKEQDYVWELILSDDGSTDGTLQALEDFAKKHSKLDIKVLANIHAGKAPTVMAGMMTARGKWRLYTDFDQSTPLKEVTRLLKHSDNRDVVFGSREMTGAKRDKEPFHRHLMGWGFNTLVRILAVPGVLDTQCGFKMFSEEAVKKLFSNLYIYGKSEQRKDAFTGAFDVELLFLAKKYGFKIREIPISWKHHPGDRVSPIKDSLRMLRDIILIRLADWRGKYST